jgi:hypothetical protein
MPALAGLLQFRTSIHASLKNVSIVEVHAKKSQGLEPAAEIGYGFDFHPFPAAPGFPVENLKHSW